MANIFEYADIFERELQQKYARELTSHALTQSNQNISFINAQTIKLPRITVSGYKDHNRGNVNFNTGNVSNTWEPKKLEHDRDIEFMLDPMDVDETNLVASIANVQNTFEQEQSIPEQDAYTYSKLYAEANTYKSDGAIIDKTVLTISNILDWFDTQMMAMDDAGVPSEGRKLYVTPAIYKLIKQAEGIQRNMDVKSASGVNRNIYSLDDVNIIRVPSARFKTAYDFTDGFTSAVGAKQINVILVHPSCTIVRSKYAYMKVFTPGSDSRTADKYLYQNRKYMDAFLIQNKASGIAFNVQA